MSELKKCPFCGCAISYYANIDEVQCDCDAMKPNYFKAEHWNTRPIEDALQARIDEMVDALVWCSGSADFAENGKARTGWIEMCQPLIDAELKEKQNE